tara:strand:+ start:661 stop:1047 length:387 start_codon:yes stop_codon:yes gene_type:complete
MPKTISTKDAPQAIGPYSQAVKAGGLLFLSGQIPLNKEGQMNDGGFEAQTRQIFENIQAILAAESLDFSSVIKINIYLIDIGNFDTVNAVMTSLFSEPYPARALVQVTALPKGSEIEVEVVAETSGSG